MTFATMRWVQTHVKDLHNSTKQVLFQFAMYAAFDDGTAAWPAIGTVADDLGISVKSVQRAVNSLVELGYMELGQQDFSGFDPRTGEPIRKDRRTIVWNVICRESDLPTRPVEEEHAQEARDMRRTALRAARRGRTGTSDRMSPRENTAKPGKRSKCRPVKSTPDTMSPRERRSAERGDILSEKVVKMSPNIQDIHTYPSAPTGHLPASGATPGDEDAKTEPEAETPTPEPAPGVDRDGDGTAPSASAPPAAMPRPVPGDGWDAFDAETADDSASDGWADGAVPPPMDPDDVASRVCERIAATRRAAGMLGVPEPDDRDRRAVRRLLDDLAAMGPGYDPAVLVTAGLDYALDSPWWLRKIHSGREFARRFTAIHDDRMADLHAAETRRDRHRDGAAARPAGEDTATRPDPSPVARARRIAETPEVVRIEPDRDRRHAHDQQIASLLAVGITADDATRRLLDDLASDRERLARQLAELDRIREANGGSMFAGAD